MMYMTQGVQYEMAQDQIFGVFVWNSLKRFRRKDWGELDESDKKMNDDAVESTERILASYDFPAAPGKNAKKIWIIMDAGHSLTTILFPDEY